CVSKVLKHPNNHCPDSPLCADALLNLSVIRCQCVPRQKTCPHEAHSQKCSCQLKLRGGTRSSTCSLGTAINLPPQAMHKGSRIPNASLPSTKASWSCT